VQDDRVSETALIVAAFRADHRLRHTPVIFDDPLAGALTSELWRTRLADGSVGQMIEELGLQNVQGQLVGRARHAELRLAAARSGSQPISHYVLLGAGLDSFAWRDPGALGSLRVLELDHPATQAYKRQRLEEIGCKTPPGVEFVTVDFEREPVDQALARAQLPCDGRVFFGWLGVVTYLSRDAFFATLAAICRSCAPGSVVLFDYAIPPGLIAPESRAFVDTVNRGTAELGEPRPDKYCPQDLHREVEALGYELVQDVSCEEMAARYFSDRSDGLGPNPEVRLVEFRTRSL
jgi:methyltransferase (TIGR00027 family)